MSTARSAWSGVGEAYAASYASLCAGTNDALIAALGPADARRSLDVGSGTGILAARMHQSGWQVTACEPEASMREIAERRHPGLAFEEGALPSLPFPDAAFDAVTANFVLNHVDDPRRSARELARVAVPGGALAATIWSYSPTWFWATVCERAGLTPATGGKLSADRDFERTASGFERMLVEADWPHVEVTELRWTWRVVPEALWTSAEGGVATAGAFYRSLDAAQQLRFRTVFDALCAEHVQDGLLGLEHSAAIAVAHTG